MIDLEALKKELIRDEGLKLIAYQDTLGYWTIGVGHRLPSGTNYKGLVWTRDKALEVLSQDIQNALDVLQKMPAYIACETDPQRRALVNMTFQMGALKMSKFSTFLKMMANKNWEGAAEDLRHTLWYRQVPNRAERICRMIYNA